MATIAPYTFTQYLDNNGDPLAGGKLYTYDAGTTTPKASYTDETEDTANANPIILDANGRANIWLGSGNYKLVLFTADDVLIQSVDNVAGQSTGGIVSYGISTNTAVTELYDSANIYVTGATTLTLLPVADAEDGFSFYVYNDGSGLVTIDPDASETINGASALVLVPGGWARVSCDGDEWYAFLSESVLNNLNASTAPTTGDDDADGYSVSSEWYDTTADEAYVCLDASTGAAVWISTTLEIGDLGSAAVADLIDDDTMATAADDNVPSAESVKAYVDNNAQTRDLLHIQDQRPSGTDGGTFTTGAWRTRNLNTVLTNEITGASLASDTVTLPAGDYYIEGEFTAFRCNQNVAKLYNDSDSSDILIGTVAYSDSSESDAVVSSNVRGNFTLGAEKDLTILHQCTLTQTGNGLGVAADFGVVEVYADLRLWKIE